MVVYPANPLLIKKASTRIKLILGLKTLDRLWKGGLTPNDLKSHYFLTWLAYWNGNVTRLAMTLGVHRNTLTWTFQAKLKHNATLKLRYLWLSISEWGPDKAFAEQVHEFHKQVFPQPLLSKVENEGLVNLWLMGFKKKDLKAHYFIWATRRGMGLEEISQKLGQNVRSIARIRTYSLRKNSPANKWFDPLKVKKKEWYLKRGPRKIKGVE
jgi:hypothetical protein